MSLTAYALNCSLKPSKAKEKSSTDKLLEDIAAALKLYGVETNRPVRAADHNIMPGVSSDEGDGDEWPAIRRRIVGADILLLGLPIWMGQPSSVAKRVLERMDAFLSETDDSGRMPATGKVAIVAVVGNEDGAHACHAACFQSLNDVGFTIPANCGVYWDGEAMGKINYVDLDKIPKNVAGVIETAASNAAHLANLLKKADYRGTPSWS